MTSSVKPQFQRVNLLDDREVKKLRREIEGFNPIFLIVTLHPFISFITLFSPGVNPSNFRSVNSSVKISLNPFAFVPKKRLHFHCTVNLRLTFDLNFTESLGQMRSPLVNYSNSEILFIVLPNST